ncbi:ATP-binding cassette domain-containing protein [Pseudoalteromonas rubra]|uniref:ABC transporter ATP-binding protein n=1 Tax=Pseudoalteromonas rubra TaxID=43658 RepID=A0A0F4QFS8_9GAMM|nr:ABC transporter ATP-binding protein [Pseudoalteromonas rubra]KJZ06436.1 hypothetical protein TW77_19355 [Pseudoalteromonas rubra]
MPISKSNLKTAGQLLAPQKSRLALLLVLTAIQAVFFTVVDPLALKWLIDAINEGNQSFFMWLAIIVTSVATGGRLLIYWTTLTRQKIKNTLQEQLSVDLANSYYQHDCQEITHHGRGYYISRLYDEPKKLSEMIDTLVAFTTCIFICISGISVAIWISWEITLALAIILPCLYLLANRFSGKISDSTKQLQESEAQFKSILATVVDSYKHVRLFSLNKTAQSTIKSGLQASLDAQYKNTRYSALYQSISAVFLSYTELAVIIVAGFQVILGVITIGSLFALTRAFSLIINAVEQLSALVPRLATLDALLDRYSEFKSLATDADAHTELTDSDTISFNNVDFDFQAKPILKSTTLTVDKCDRVLISGPNGAGKSTLAHLLTGFYTPNQGEISKPAMSHISASLYPFGLLPGTLGDNIDRIIAQGGDRQKADELIAKLGILECLDKPFERLSEGQKKKCQIAICLLKTASVYLLDEPLANIDDASKSDILQIINDYTQNAALLMIMHEGNRFSHMFNRFLNIEGQGNVKLV